MVRAEQQRAIECERMAERQSERIRARSNVAVQEPSACACVMPSRCSLASQLCVAAAADAWNYGRDRSIDATRRSHTSSMSEHDHACEGEREE